MESVSLLRVAGVGLVLGASTAIAVMGAYALRAAWVISSGRRWYQLKQF